MPIRPWRVSPLRYATPSAISESSRRRRHCASASIFARRLRVAATRSEAARSSASSMIDSGMKNLYDLPRCPGILRISGFDHCSDEERPRGEETKATDRRDRAEPDREQAERVIDVVLDAGVPYREHLGRQAAFQRVRAECAERHRGERGEAACGEEELCACRHFF